MTRVLAAVVLTSLLAFPVTGGRLLAHAQEATPAAADTEAVALRFVDVMIEIFATGNADLLDDVVAAEYVDRTPSLTRTGGAATPDLAGLKTTFVAVHDVFPESTVTVEASIVQGDMAALLVTFHGMRGPGTTVDGVLVLRVADGKFVEGWNYERGGEAPLQPMFEATPEA
jgi:predicted SnoaL-like aldol condensation-catalyzing enzyme